MGNNKFYRRGEFSKRLEESLDPDGSLAQLMDYVRKDSELDMQFRGNYINIYYKGGNILKINPCSFDFDKFYLYLGAEKDKLWTRKTNIEKAAKGAYKGPLTEQKAKEIINELEGKRDVLKSDLPNDFKSYFEKAKEIMDKWFAHMETQGLLERAEKEIQHKISLSNRDFNHSDILILDVEYAISQKSTFSENGTNPRADMIGIDKNGLIHVLELKYKTQSAEGTAGIKKHLEDFVKTIKIDDKGNFRAEMVILLNQKRKFQLIKEDNVHIEEEKAPVFDLIFYGLDSDEREKVENKYQRFKEDINHIYYLEKGNYILRNE